MLYKILDTIRAKPKAVRDQYALGTAVLCTLLITGVWSLSLPSRFTTTSLAAAGAASSTSPFSGLIGQIKKQFAGAKEKVQPMPVPVIVAPPTVASSTADALELQLSDETKAGIESGTTSLRFSDTTYGTTTTLPAPHQTILIATSAQASSTSE